MRTTKVYKLVIHKKGFGGSGQYWLIFGDCVSWLKLWCALKITHITRETGQVRVEQYQRSGMVGNESTGSFWKAFFTFRVCWVVFWIQVLPCFQGSFRTHCVAQAGFEPIILLPVYLEILYHTWVNFPPAFVCFVFVFLLCSECLATSLLEKDSMDCIQVLPPGFFFFFIELITIQVSICKDLSSSSWVQLLGILFVCLFVCLPIEITIQISKFFTFSCFVVKAQNFHMLHGFSRL